MDCASCARKIEIAVSKVNHIKQVKVLFTTKKLIVDAAESALEAFSAKWDEKYPTISPSWINNWERLVVIFDFAPEIRKAIYTTNVIESLNASLLKITKTRRVFPTEESVIKLFYLALHNISIKLTMPIKDWKPAMSQFMLMYGDRFTR